MQPYKEQQVASIEKTAIFARCHSQGLNGTKNGLVVAIKAQYQRSHGIEVPILRLNFQWVELF